MSDDKNLLYRPSLDYEKDYSSTGKPEDIIIEEGNIINEEDSHNEIEDLIDLIEDIKNVIPILPDDLGDVLSTPIKGVEYVIGTIDDEDYDPDVPTDNETIITVDDDPEKFPEQPKDNTIVPEDPFSEDIVDPINIDVKVIPKYELIEKQYVHDLVSVLKDYALNMQNVITSYIGTLVAISDEAKINITTLSKSYYNGSAVNIKNSNNVHLSDALIRMQIMRGQKTRLYSKLYDIDSTILHIRSCKATTELKKRYYKEEYKNNDKLLDIGSNIILSGSRDAYDKKYKENFKNLYKYLNSSVILINESLQINLQEIQAKAILINKEGMDIK